MKVAIIGVGYWGPNLVRNLFELNVLYAICDKNPNALEKLKSVYKYNKFKFTTKPSTIFKDNDIDIVVISTPPETHYMLAKEALLNNKHVFVEKPLTLKSEHAEELVELAESKKLVLMVGHTFLYSPDIIKLKQIIKAEDFGEIYYLYSRRLNLGKIQSPANVIQDLAPHDISIFQYLLGLTCKKVQAVGASYILGNIEEIAFINFIYENDIFINLHLSWLDPLKIRDIVVVGSNKMVTCDSLNKQIHIYNKGVDIDKRRLMNEGTYAEHLLNYRYGEEIIPYIESYEPLREEMKDLLKAVENGRSPKSNGILGLQVVNILEATQESIKRGGKWISI